MKRKNILILIILIVPLVFIFSLFSCQISYDRSLGQVERSEVEIIYDDKEVKAGDIRWELLEAEDLGPIIGDELGATLQPLEGKFIYISFLVENTGEDVRQIFDLKVIDDKGRIYSICTEAYGYIFTAPEVCIVQDAPPGVERNFDAVFDVPVDSENLVLEVTDLNIPPKEKKYIDLGI